MSKPNYSKPVDRLMVMPMPLARLLGMAHPGNPKEHAIDDLIASFNRFGFKSPPAIDETTMVMVAGHGRCIALEQMRATGASAPIGIEVKDSEWMVPVLRGMTFKTEQERNAYIIAENQTTIAGGWSFEVLADMLRSIEDGGFEGLGFSESALDNILNPEPDEPEPDEDDHAVNGSSSDGPRDVRDSSPREVERPRTGGREVGVVEHTRVIGGHKVKPALNMTNDDWMVHLGDCIQGMRSLADNSVDAIVTDPPAGVNIAGKEWDSDKGGRDQWIAWLAEVMTEGLRVLKPGGHMFSWALPRTSHWTATGIEDAGFQIADLHHHIFLTGMPKSLDLEREIDMHLCVLPGKHCDKHLPDDDARAQDDHLCPPHPRRGEAKARRTALAPAVEHYVLARKPREGTYAENVLTHGTGGINVEACRIPMSEDDRDAARVPNPKFGAPGPDRPLGLGGTGRSGYYFEPSAGGRWPRHLSVEQGVPINGIDDPARYFYCPKPSRQETEAGLDDLPASTGGEATGRKDGSVGVDNPRAGAGRCGGRKNTHVSKKPIELMRWLIRLVATPGCTVLDMFAGSGTTGLAALVEGCKFIGFEKEPEYHAIACARLKSLIDENGIESDPQEELDLGDEVDPDDAPSPEASDRPEDWRRREMLTWVGGETKTDAADQPSGAAPSADLSDPEHG